jgi:hypothetical protein
MKSSENSCGTKASSADQVNSEAMRFSKPSVETAVVNSEGADSYYTTPGTDPVAARDNWEVIKNILISQ